LLIILFLILVLLVILLSFSSGLRIRKFRSIPREVPTMSNASERSPSPASVQPAHPAAVGAPRGRPWRRFLLFTVLVVSLVICGIAIGQQTSLSFARLTRNRNAAVVQRFALSRRAPRILPDQTRSPAADDFESFQRTQAALIKSRPVIARALRTDAIAGLSIVRKQQDPVKWLEESLQVDFKESPEIMRVSLTGEEVDQLRQLVSAVSDAYISEVNEDELSDRNRRLMKLKDIAASYDATLQSKRKTLRALAQEVGDSAVSMPETKRNAAQKMLDAYADELARTRIASIRAKARLNRLAGKDAAGIREKAGPLRDEIDMLEETAKLLQQELEKAAGELKGTTRQAVELDSLREEIDQTAAFSRMLHGEIERRNVEISVPLRVNKMGEPDLVP
jgi:hypothetical protein